MKTLLTGANGFLGLRLSSLLVDEGFDVVGTGRSNREMNPKDGFVYEKLDFTDPYAVHDVFDKHHPAIVVHAGAMTKVDACEDNQSAAYAINVEGTLNLISNSAGYKSFFIFISTDFVFDGGKGNYDEKDETGPVNFYGRTKAEGEEAVKEYEHVWAIVRTSLVYGKSLGGRDNIISVVKRKLESGESYGLVNDQYRSPTFVDDLAAGIVLIIKKKVKGIFHLAGRDMLTPYQMGMKTVEKLHGPLDLIHELDAEHFFQRAKRPVRTNLSIQKAITDLGYDPVSFDEGLKRTLG